MGEWGDTAKKGRLGHHRPAVILSRVDMVLLYLIWNLTFEPIFKGRERD